MAVKSVRRGRRKAKRVRIGEPDPSLTGRAGLAAVGEFVEKVGMVGAFDEAIGSIKVRARGASAGELVVGLAQAQLAGTGYWSGLDQVRADAVAAEVSAVPFLASTTAAGLARRFTAEHIAGIEAGSAQVIERAVGLLSPQRREALAGAVTMDMDSTDVEVFGSDKQGVAYNYCGQRCGRPHVVTWAEAAVTVAADLMAGNADVRPVAADLLARGLAAIPESIRVAATDAGTLRLRADSGYFAAGLAAAAADAGVDFAIAAKRNTALWRAYAGIAADQWTDAIDMDHAQVATCDYAPARWPPGTYTIVRRVPVAATDISADPRARRRRTIPTDQLTLALGGHIDQAYAVSFIVTNIPTYDNSDDGELITDIEHWFRHRTDIEERIRDAKHGAALRHLPSGKPELNTVWMWAALLAINISVLLQAVTGIDDHGRRHGPRLRAELICIPARRIHHGRTITWRLPPGQHLLPQVLARIRELPTPA